MRGEKVIPVSGKEEICLAAIRSGRVTIDDEGRVWKHWRNTKDGGRSFYDPPRRADHADKLGYCRVCIHIGKVLLTVYAHRLIWVHKNGPIPAGLEINHIDGVKSNNRLSNLELVTKSGNQRHSVDVTKTHKPPVGEKNHLSKMTWPKVDELRRRRREEQPTPTYAQLGKDFDITGVAARCICLELTWKEKHRPATV